MLSGDVLDVIAGFLPLAVRLCSRCVDAQYQFPFESTLFRILSFL